MPSMIVDRATVEERFATEVAALDSHELRPHALGHHGILLVARLRVDATAVERSAISGLIGDRLRDVYAASVRPADHRLAAPGDAVAFCDEAELRAVLLRELVSGRSLPWWWHRGVALLGGGADPSAVLGDDIRLTPTIVTTLDRWDLASTVVARLSTRDAREIFDRIRREHGLAVAHGVGEHADPVTASGDQPGRSPAGDRPTAHPPLLPARLAELISDVERACLDHAMGALLVLCRALRNHPGLVRTETARRALSAWCFTDAAPAEPITAAEVWEPLTARSPGEAAMADGRVDWAEPLAAGWPGDWEAPDLFAAHGSSSGSTAPSVPSIASSDDGRSVIEPPPIARHRAVPGHRPELLAPDGPERTGVVATGLGGSLFVVNLLRRFVWWEQRGSWSAVEGALRGLVGLLRSDWSTDPLWRELARLDGRGPDGPPADPDPHARLPLAASLERTEEAAAAELLVRPAELAITATHVDVLLPMSELSVAVRVAGLDIDPEWVPQLGRVITFHYREATA